MADPSRARCRLSAGYALFSRSVYRDLRARPADWTLVGSGLPSAALDFNGDRVNDLASTRALRAGSLLRPGGDLNALRTPLAWTAGDRPVVADFNGDGQPDVAFGAEGLYLDVDLFPFGGGVAVLFGPQRTPTS